MKFAIIRNGITATSVEASVLQLNFVRRWVASSLRGSACDAGKYHLVAWSEGEDISATDRLEEITGTVTGTIYSIVNKREIDDRCYEFDLEPDADRD